MQVCTSRTVVYADGDWGYLLYDSGTIHLHRAFINETLKCKKKNALTHVITISEVHNMSI